MRRTRSPLTRGLRDGVALAALIAGAAVPAFATTLIETSAGASSIRYDLAGNIAEDNSDDDQTGVAGVAVSAAVLPACAGACAIVPDFTWHSGSAAAAEARTSYGGNGVRTFAGVYETHPNGVQAREDTAGATSLWADEWTFLSSTSGPLGPVTVDIELDGSWNDYGMFGFLVSVTDSTTGNPVADASVHSCGPGGGCTAVDPAVFQEIQLPDAGATNGSLDATFQLTFQPVVNRTYNVLSWMAAESSPPITTVDGGEVDAFSTGRVVRVTLPAGVSMNSAAGASANYNVTTIPEPSAATLLGLAMTFLAVARRRG
jgi:hypothetical protein